MSHFPGSPVIYEKVKSEQRPGNGEHVIISELSKKLNTEINKIENKVIPFTLISIFPCENKVNPFTLSSIFPCYLLF